MCLSYHTTIIPTKSYAKPAFLDFVYPLICAILGRHLDLSMLAQCQLKFSFCDWLTMCLNW